MLLCGVFGRMDRAALPYSSDLSLFNQSQTVLSALPVGKEPEYKILLSHVRISLNNLTYSRVDLEGEPTKKCLNGKEFEPNSSLKSQANR